MLSSSTGTCVNGAGNCCQAGTTYITSIRGKNHRAPATTASAGGRCPTGMMSTTACRSLRANCPHCTSTAAIGSHKAIHSGTGQHVLSARNAAPLVPDRLPGQGRIE